MASEVHAQTPLLEEESEDASRISEVSDDKEKLAEYTEWLNKSSRIIAVVAGLHAFTSQLPLRFIALYSLTTFRISMMTAAHIFPVFYVFSMLSTLTSNIVAPRWGYDFVLTVFAVCCGTGYLTCALTSSFPIFLVGCALAGISGAHVCFGFIGSISMKNNPDTMKYTGRIQISHVLSALSSAQFGGFIYEYAGGVYVFYTSVGLSILSTLFILVFLVGTHNEFKHKYSELVSQQDDTNSSQNDVGMNDFQEASGWLIVVLVCCVVFVCDGNLGLLLNYLVVYMKQKFDVNVILSVTQLTLMDLLGIASIMAFEKASFLHSNQLVNIAVFLVGSFTIVFVFALFGSPVVAWICIPIYGIFHALITVRLPPLFIDATSRENMGIATAMHGISANLGFGLFPLIWVSSELNMFVFMSSLVVIAEALVLIVLGVVSLRSTSISS